MRLFSDPNVQKYSYVHSMDDKAYVRPGTSEGFAKTRNLRILTLTGNEGRQLPKYDWPEDKVYQTPAAHRIIKKETKEVDGKDMLFTTSDRHFVIVRPKAFVDSSGTTWASEKVRLRQEEPDTFEVVEGSLSISSRVISYASKVRDTVFLYNDMSVERDYERVTNNPSCPYSAYEIERLEHLLQNLSGSKTYKAIAGKIMFQKCFN